MGKILSYQSHLGTEVLGQNGHGPCKGVNMWGTYSPKRRSWCSEALGSYGHVWLLAPGSCLASCHWLSGHWPDGPQLAQCWSWPRRQPGKETRTLALLQESPRHLPPHRPGEWDSGNQGLLGNKAVSPDTRFSQVFKSHLPRGLQKCFLQPYPTHPTPPSSGGRQDMFFFQ